MSRNPRGGVERNHEVTGEYRNGRVELDEAVDCPDEIPVAVSRADASPGLTEQDWSQTDEQIRALLAQHDAIESLELAPNNAAEFAAVLRAARAASINAVCERMELKA